MGVSVLLMGVVGVVCDGALGGWSVCVVPAGAPAGSAAGHEAGLGRTKDEQVGNLVGILDAGFVPGC